MSQNSFANNTDYLLYNTCISDNNTDYLLYNTCISANNTDYLLYNTCISDNNTDYLLYNTCISDNNTDYLLYNTCISANFPIQSTVLVITKKIHSRSVASISSPSICSLELHVSD